jgi:hypothetical protein
MEWFFRLGCAAALGAMAFMAHAQQPDSGSESGLTTIARAKADAEHQEARARCEVEPRPKWDGCLRAADERYDRALAGENSGEHGNRGTNAGAKPAGVN